MHGYPEAQFDVLTLEWYHNRAVRAHNKARGVSSVNDLDLQSTALLLTLADISGAYLRYGNFDNSRLPLDEWEQA